MITRTEQGDVGRGNEGGGQGEIQSSQHWLSVLRKIGGRDGGRENEPIGRGGLQRVQVNEFKSTTSS